MLSAKAMSVKTGPVRLGGKVYGENGKLDTESKTSKADGDMKTYENDLYTVWSFLDRRRVSNQARLTRGCERREPYGAAACAGRCVLASQPMSWAIVRGGMCRLGSKEDVTGGLKARRARRGLQGARRGGRGGRVGWWRRHVVQYFESGVNVVNFRVDMVIMIPLGRPQQTWCECGRVS